MDFIVNKKNLKETRTVPSPPLPLQEGDALIRVDKFAFTANNVSYAATGDALGYWKFFPLDNDKSSNSGRVPVWGTGTIVASRCSSFQQGQTVYGYFPMSQFVVLHPIHVTPSDFIDGSPHRKSLPAVYNQYLICEEDPFYTPRTQEAMMVLRALFFTSWLLVDFFVQSNFYGANTVIISSASSKTSIGLAFVLKQYNKNRKQKDHNIHIVGLTSPRNLAFVQQLQLYNHIIVYNQIEQQLDDAVPKPACFVDMAGNTQVTSRLHHHLQHNLKYSCLVGASHIGQGGKPAQPLPGPRPKFFFAPSWTARRIVELGGGRNNSSSGNLPTAAITKRRGLQILLHRVLIDYQRFVHWSCHQNNNNNGINDVEEGQGWLKMKHYFGPEQVAKGYTACLNGDVGPSTAVIMSLWEDDAPKPSIQSRL